MPHLKLFTLIYHKMNLDAVGSGVPVNLKECPQYSANSAAPRFKQSRNCKESMVGSRSSGIYPSTLLRRSCFPCAKLYPDVFCGMDATPDALASTYAVDLINTP